MKLTSQIPCYAPDGTSIGYRTVEAAKRLIGEGQVTPSYGRKGHLKAIWLLQQDGGNPVEPKIPMGRRYSFLQRLDSGQRCWQHRPMSPKVDGPAKMADGSEIRG